MKGRKGRTLVKKTPGNMTRHIIHVFAETMKIGEFDAMVYFQTGFSDNSFTDGPQTVSEILENVLILQDYLRVHEPEECEQNKPHIFLDGIAKAIPNRFIPDHVLDTMLFRGHLKPDEKMIERSLKRLEAHKPKCAHQFADETWARSYEVLPDQLREDLGLQ